MLDVVILGAGGHAREVADVLVACNECDRRYRILGFVDEKVETHGGSLNGIPVLGDFTWLREAQKTSLRVVAGIGSPVSRRNVVKRARSLGLEFCNAIHPTVVLTSFLTIGDGVMVSAGSILTNQIAIGNHVSINLDCTISHDCVIEDFCNLSPGVHIAGNVRLAEGCDLGVGAVVAQGITIGRWSIVGAGAVVVDDIPPNVTVVGVPARVIKTRGEGWHES